MAGQLDSLIRAQYRDAEELLGPFLQAGAKILMALIRLSRVLAGFLGALAAVLIFRLPGG